MVNYVEKRRQKNGYCRFLPFRRCNPTPSLKPVLKDPTMGMKTFLFLHRIGLIELFQQNVKVNISVSVLIIMCVYKSYLYIISKVSYTLLRD